MEEPGERIEYCSTIKDWRFWDWNKWWFNFFQEAGEVEEEWEYVGRILQFGLEEVGGVWISGDAFLGERIIFETDEWAGWIGALRWEGLQDSEGYRDTLKDGSMVWGPHWGWRQWSCCGYDWYGSGVRAEKGWLVRLARWGLASTCEHQWWGWAEKRVQVLNHWILTKDRSSPTGREWRGPQIKGPNVVKGQERGGPEGLELLQEPRSRVWLGVCSSSTAGPGRLPGWLSHHHWSSFHVLPGKIQEQKDSYKGPSCVHLSVSLNKWPILFHL